MAKKQKYYVIWEGHQKGIFDTWSETEKTSKDFPMPNTNPSNPVPTPKPHPKRIIGPA